MQKLTFRSIGKILEKPVRRKLLFLAIARIAANLLDLLGLAGIALLATAFGSLASGSATRAPLNLPLIGEWYINEYEAVFIAMGVVAVFLLKSGFSIWLNLITSLTVAGLEGKHSTDLAKSFFSFGGETSLAQSVAEFQNRAMYSANAISTFLNARLSFIAEGSLLIAMVLIFLLVNPVASLAMFAIMGSVLVALNRVINLRVAANGLKVMEGNEESLRVSRDLQGIRREAMSSGVTSGWLQRFRGARYQAAEGSALIFTLQSMPRFVVETTLILGIFGFLGGVVVFSDLSTQAVTIGVFLAGGLRLIASVLPLQSALTAMKDGAARGQLAFEALISIKDSEVPSSSEIANIAKGTLVFRGVSFRYPGSDFYTLRNVSFEVEENTKFALVGRSGAGKSTLFDLATGFHLPETGEIEIGGVSPRNLIQSGTGQIGIVPQRPTLVSGSLLENVALVPRGDCDVDRVAEVMVKAGLKHFVDTAGDWRGRIINPDSGELSGGEIQRLGIARALYRRPKILFLDEATSALDAETESEITAVLESLKREMTVILIAHRLSTVVRADKIAYLKDGEVVAQGTFEELKAAVPDFASAVSLMSLDSE